IHVDRFADRVRLRGVDIGGIWQRFAARAGRKGKCRDPEPGCAADECVTLHSQQPSLGSSRAQSYAPKAVKSSTPNGSREVGCRNLWSGRSIQAWTVSSTPSLTDAQRVFPSARHRCALATWEARDGTSRLEISTRPSP